MKLRYLRNVVTLELNVEKCIGCGMCVAVCPHRVFQFENKKAVITDKDACMECGACSLNCPVEAINVEAGVGCAAAVINGFLGKTGSECCCCDSKSK
ncbi:MAG: mercury methylation ferredoxin HgcB [Planctomycetota bacterium]|jgi:NAD-dependent dihydropyrimidine dehydrogenase PreA subunit